MLYTFLHLYNLCIFIPSTYFVIRNSEYKEQDKGLYPISNEKLEEQKATEMVIQSKEWKSTQAAKLYSRKNLV